MSANECKRARLSSREESGNPRARRVERRKAHATWLWLNKDKEALPTQAQPPLTVSAAFERTQEQANAAGPPVPSMQKLHNKLI